MLCECWLVNSLPVRGTGFWNIAATDIFTNMNTKHIFVIMGPAGCGKSSVATALAEMLGMPMVEGDDVRPLMPGLLGLTKTVC